LQIVEVEVVTAPWLVTFLHALHGRFHARR